MKPLNFDDLKPIAAKVEKATKDLFAALGNDAATVAAELPKDIKARDEVKTKVNNWITDVTALLNKKVKGKTLDEVTAALKADYDAKPKSEWSDDIVAEYQVIIEEIEKLTNAKAVLDAATTALDTKTEEPQPTPVDEKPIENASGGDGIGKNTPAEDDTRIIPSDSPAKVDPKPADAAPVAGMMAGSLSASYSRKFSIDTTVTSSIVVKMTPYPPPKEFIDAMVSAYSGTALKKK